MPESLVALEEARSRAEALLGERFAEGLIDDEELEARIDRLLEAGDMATIDAIVADLLEPGTALVPVGAPATAQVTALARPDEIQDVARFSSVIGDTRRRGVWVPARVNQVRTVIGDAVFDLREARLGAGVTEFRIQGGIADLELIVAPGTRVADGIEQVRWEPRPNWMVGEEAKGVALVPSGGLVVVGQATTSAQAGVTFRVDANGDELWARTGDVSPYSGRNRGVAINAAEQIAVAGVQGQGPSDSDAVIELLDLDGNPIWETTYAGPDGGYDGAHAVAFADNGDVIVVGVTNGLENWATGEWWAARYAGAP